MSTNIFGKLSENVAKNIYSSFRHPPYVLERKLIMYMQQLDEQNSLEVLNQINALERANLSDSPLNSIKNSLICSCTLFSRAIIEAGVSSEIAFIASDYYIRIIDESSTIAKIEKIEYDMVTEFIQLLKTYKENIYNPMINRTILYIRQNLELRITLQKIADHVKVHPNYLSSAFKKEVGISISTYINKQKIENIKLFLTQTTLSLSEIAYTFDFSSQAHFSRFFKKNVGISPLIFRNQFTINN